MTPGAGPEDVVDACLEIAHDGTRAAIEAVVETVRNLAPGDAVAPALRAAIAPFDTVGPDYRKPAMDARLPSRTKSIEELPVALGFVLAHGGDFVDSVLGAVNYGRDADSIATMAGAVAAALGGREVIPTDWVSTIESASRVDLTAVGHQMAAVATEIARRDAERAHRQLRRIAALTDTTGGTRR